MRNFTDECRRQATGAWGAAGSFPEKYPNWKKSPGLSGRAQRGCLGVLIFAIVYLLLPFMIFLCVETVIVSWALLMSLLWAIGAGFDRAHDRGSGSPPLQR